MVNVIRGNTCHSGKLPTSAVQDLFAISKPINAVSTTGKSARWQHHLSGFLEAEFPNLQVREAVIKNNILFFNITEIPVYFNILEHFLI